MKRAVRKVARRARCGERRFRSIGICEPSVFPGGRGGAGRPPVRARRATASARLGVGAARMGACGFALRSRCRAGLAPVCPARALGSVGGREGAAAVAAREGWGSAATGLPRGREGVGREEAFVRCQLGRGRHRHAGALRPAAPRAFVDAEGHAPVGQSGGGRAKVQAEYEGRGS